MYIFLVLGILVLAFYYSVVKNNDYWKKRKVPFDEPKFFFGNFKDVILGKQHFAMMYFDLYQKFKQYPYFGYFKLKEPAMVINDPQLIKNVLIKDFINFADNDFTVDPEVDKVFAANIFGQSGEAWKKNRSAWTYGMTTSKIKAMYEKINEKCDIMVDYIRQEIKENPNKSIEARLLASRFFTDAIVDCMLGLKINSFQDKNNPYTTIAITLFKSDFWQGLVTVMFIVAPWLGKLLKIRFVPKNMENELLRLSREILEMRSKTGYQKNNPFDAIILQGDNKDCISEIQVAGYLFGFLIDGTETSSGVSGFALCELASNIDVQNKLREELDRLAENNGGKLTYDDIHQAPYLDMVISETLRKYPPAMAIQRLCTKDYDLPPIETSGQPVRIPAGMPVTIPTYALHKNPKYFPDPEKFDPERFNDENKNKIEKYVYLPFGEGPRICLGVRLALNQVKIELAAIIRNFEVRPAPEMASELQIDPTIFILRRVGGLWVTLRNRQRQ